MLPMMEHSLARSGWRVVMPKRDTTSGRIKTFRFQIHYYQYK